MRKSSMLLLGKFNCPPQKACTMLKTEPELWDDRMARNGWNCQQKKLTWNTSYFQVIKHCNRRSPNKNGGSSTAKWQKSSMNGWCFMSFPATKLWLTLPLRFSSSSLQCLRMFCRGSNIRLASQKIYPTGVLYASWYFMHGLIYVDFMLTCVDCMLICFDHMLICHTWFRNMADPGKWAWLPAQTLC